MTIVTRVNTGEKLVAKREFNNPMDKHAVKVVKDDESNDQRQVSICLIFIY